MEEIKGHDGQVTFDGQNIFINRRGILAKMIGYKDKVIPVKSVIMVSMKDATSYVNGHIFFATKESGLMKSSFDSHENMVVFRKSQQKEFSKLKNKINKSISSLKSILESKEPLLTKDLNELVEMYKEGKISSEEFKRQKTIILENL